MSTAVDKSVASNQDAVLLIGRILLSLLVLVAAWGKVRGLGGAEAYFTKLGVPSPSIMAPAVMIFEAVVGIMLVVGFKTRIAAILLALFCIVTAAVAHTNIADGNQLNHLLKNLAITGGALALAVSGPGAYSVDKR